MNLGVHIRGWRKKYGKYVLFGSLFLFVSLLSIQSWSLSQSSWPLKLAVDANTITLEPFPAPTVTQTPAPETAPPAATEAPKSTSKSKPKSSSTPSAAPTTDIAPASSCPGQDQLAQYQSVLLCMTNYARKFHGLGSVSINSVLTESAEAKAQDIVTCAEFSHTACGRASNYWIQNKGYTGSCSAENIAQGQKNPGKVFIAWMNSSGHRANILRATYIHLGVAQVPGGTYSPTWVMHLGGC